MTAGVVGRLAIFVLAGGSIAALLADLHGIASMHVVFLAVSLPSMVALAVLGFARRVPAELRAIIALGALGGLVGTIGYDLVRVPFALAGQRVFAPIESYGLLIADASVSSGWTSGLGWLYHFSNGVAFGIAYGALAARRHWGWGVVWAMLLETVAVLGPFADRYQIRGNEYAIGIAYAAHVCYGAPLGRIVQRMDRLKEGVTPAMTAVALGVLPLALLGWTQPWSTSVEEQDAARLGAPGTPATVVVDDRFEPEWLRVESGPTKSRARATSSSAIASPATERSSPCVAMRASMVSNCSMLRPSISTTRPSRTCRDGAGSCGLATATSPRSMSSCAKPSRLTRCRSMNLTRPTRGSVTGARRR